MPANEYEFVTRWTVKAPIGCVYEILKNGAEYPQWWPDVYLNSEAIPSGDPRGIGDKVVLLTKGRLPYTLRWTATSLRLEPPSLIEIEATGDFVGKGKWTLTESGDETEIRFDWVLRADKPMIRMLSPIMKPIFRWNHRWAMDRGYESLLGEIKRRQKGD